MLKLIYQTAVLVLLIEFTLSTAYMLDTSKNHEGSRDQLIAQTQRF
jgi:hypothetical protein